MTDTFDTFGLDRGAVSVIGATGLVVGNVIGISIFTLPGPLAADAGPVVIFGILLAAIPLVFGIGITYQLGSAIPTTGGNYIYASRLVHPFAGFLLPWLILPGVWAGLLFIGVGFAEYVGLFVATPDLVLIYLLLTTFLILNIVGIHPVARVQLLFVGVLIGSMLLFIVPGAFHIEPSNYTPLLPNGVGPFALAVVSLYFPLRGFSMVANIGDELENPSQAIPRVLLLSALIALSLFIALVAVLVGVVNYTELGVGDGAVVMAAERFLPGPLAGLLAVGAVAGGFTSISTTYTGFSRALMRAANDGIFPTVFAAVHDRFSTPHIALLALGVPPLLLAPLQPSPVILSIFLAIAILTVNCLNAVALWRLPQVFPDRYTNASVTLSPLSIRIVAIGGAVSSLVLIGVTSLRLPLMVGVIAAYIAVGYLVFSTSGLATRTARYRPPRGDALTGLN
ncbi:amino acid permease [Natronomonas sp. CBA1123]|uniref:APC family permease n=1 Tax=Natronomonas sp. CBA1123 TaxID=2668070 RepID=UPI0012EA3560|nr:APC family permease [Natronomonas sp. CBA1123]MUV85394.1 amino acid permease [Natronomonas sp. CBA1123]